MLCKSSVFFRITSSSELNLIFIIFFIIIIWVILCWTNKISHVLHSSSQFFSASLLSSVWTNLKYLFPLCSSMYLFVLLIMRYKVLRYLVLNNHCNKDSFVWFSVSLDVIRSIFYVDCIIKKVERTTFITCNFTRFTTFYIGFSYITLQKQPPDEFC